MTQRQRDYLKFLQTDFWKELTAYKKRTVGKCECCGSCGRLESHHIYYPKDWFQTTPDMLRVLCRDCHEAEHASRPKVPEVFHSMAELSRYRSKRAIDRATFEHWRKILSNRGQPRGQVGGPRKRRKKGAGKSKYYVGDDGLMHRGRRKKRVPTGNGRRKAMNIYEGRGWVNRGTSSN